MQVQPYLFFNGRSEEAVEFYRSALGAEVTMLMRFKDSPAPQPPGAVPPGSENKVMHVSFRIGDTTVMASDGQCQGQPNLQSYDCFAGIGLGDQARGVQRRRRDRQQYERGLVGCATRIRHPCAVRGARRANSIEQQYRGARFA